MHKILREDEQVRANRFHFAKDKRAFSLGRAYLRLILAQYLQLSPQELVFNYTSKGKPYLQNCPLPLEFNLSHSHNLVVYAVTQKQPIGVDVEYVRDLSQMIALAKRYFTPKESAFISSCDSTQQSLAFFQGWTTKEAFLKATGLGIGGGLSSLEVEVNPHKPAHIYSISDPCFPVQEWFVRRIDIFPDYIVTVARQGPINYQLWKRHFA